MQGVSSVEDALFCFYFVISCAAERQTETADIVCVKNRTVLKLKIRNGVTVAFFGVRSELIRNYKSQTAAASGIKETETEVIVTDDASFATACDMVDLMIAQHRREIRERCNAL